MDKMPYPAAARREAEMPTDLLAGLLMEQAAAPAAPARKSDKLPARIYGVMAVTTLLTFATLTTGYQVLFAH